MGITIPDDSLRCPWPDCREEVLISYSCTWGTLSQRDLDAADQIEPQHATAQTWSVDCLAGHTLLLPGRTGCDCSDHEEGGLCPVEELFDWGDEHEHRTFRIHDWNRLRGAIALIGGVS